jgi:Transposase IS116/IS110/IS902 family
VSLYWQFGLTALARKRRTESRQHRNTSAKLKEAIEGIALQKPPIPVAAICRQSRRLAQDLGEEPPSYWLVYRIVAALPADLVTLAHEGTKAYSNAFELVYRREAGGPNAIWQADHTPLDILAPRLLSLFGSDRSRWADASDIQKYSGIAPVIERSGQSVWVHRRLSRLRETLNASQHSLISKSTDNSLIIAYRDWVPRPGCSSLFLGSRAAV